MRGLNAPPRRLTPILSFTLAASLIIALAPATATAQTGTVAVSGSSSRLVPNDLAELTFVVSKDRDTARAALDALAPRARAVIRRVRAAGDVARSDVRTLAINVRRVVIRDSEGRRQRVFYRASEAIGVVIRDVRRVSAAIGAGVEAGATSVRGPRFSVAEPDAVYDRVLAAAFDRAREKAEVLAERAGRTLGQVISISEEGGVTRLGGTATGGGEGAAADGPPVNPGRSRVRAVVRVVFELQ
jgi:uncharacterized protein YggE